MITWSPRLSPMGLGEDRPPAPLSHSSLSPLAGSRFPSQTEGLKLRAILVENRDPTDGTGNFIPIAPGSNGLTSWLAGTNPTLRVPAGGVQLATFPEGLDAMNDGSDDEILLTANSASVICRLTYLYG